MVKAVFEEGRYASVIQQKGPLSKSLQHPTDRVIQHYSPLTKREPGQSQYTHQHRGPLEQRSGRGKGSASQQGAEARMKSGRLRSGTTREAWWRCWRGWWWWVRFSPCLPSQQQQHYGIRLHRRAAERDRANQRRAESGRDRLESGARSLVVVMVAVVVVVVVLVLVVHSFPLFFISTMCMYNSFPFSPTAAAAARCTSTRRRVAMRDSASQ